MLRPFLGFTGKEKHYPDRINKGLFTDLKILELGIITPNLKEEVFVYVLPNIRKFNLLKEVTDKSYCLEEYKHTHA